jgi:site-specific recombinase XerD
MGSSSRSVHLASLGDTPQVTHFAKTRTNGLSQRTTKVHTLRHTFARAMEEAGARVTEIQQRLGHNDLSTTGRYLEALASAKNSHGEAVAEALGVE